MMHMMWWLNRLYGMGSLLAVMVVILRAGKCIGVSAIVKRSLYASRSHAE